VCESIANVEVGDIQRVGGREPGILTGVPAKLYRTLTPNSNLPLCKAFAASKHPSASHASSSVHQFSPFLEVEI
jgi:hypothetical protein